jgi:hypothetical protein
MPEGIDLRSSSDPSAPPADCAPAVAPPERSGPLALARHRKADGRLLILYSREDDTGGRASESDTAGGARESGGTHEGDTAGGAPETGAPAWREVASSKDG